MDQILKKNKKHRHNTSTHKSSHQPDKSTENSIFYNMTIDLKTRAGRDHSVWREITEERSAAFLMSLL